MPSRISICYTDFLYHQPICLLATKYVLIPSSCVVSLCHIKLKTKKHSNVVFLSSLIINSLGNQAVYHSFGWVYRNNSQMGSLKSLLRDWMYNFLHFHGSYPTHWIVDSESLTTTFTLVQHSLSLISWFVFFFFNQDRISLDIPDWCGTHCVSWLALNLWQSLCLSLWSVWIICVNHHPSLTFTFKLKWSDKW